MKTLSLVTAMLLGLPSFAPAQATTQLDTARDLINAGAGADAAAIVRPLVDTGNVEAMNVLGYMYEHGIGLAADPEQALDLYRRSAEGGYATAMSNLGFAYRDGSLGVAADPIAALDWFTRAAVAGDVAAHVDIGLLHESGQIGSPDYVMAERHYRIAAEAGVPLGMNNLGVLYRVGDGVPVDFDLARQWFTDAAETGSAVAVGELAIMMELGEGQPVDLDGARVGYEAAMRMGHVESGYWAAWMFADNPAYFGNPVRGSAYCHWALARATATEQAQWSPDCDRWFGALSAKDTAAAIALAETF